MLGLAFAALCMALVKREQLLMTLWLVFGAVFQSIQFYVQDNHRVVINAPMCFLTAWWLGDVERRAEQPPHTRGSLTWTSLLLTLLVAFGSTRVLLAMVSVRNTEKPAVAWLAAHTGARDTVVAAAYVLMQPRRILCRMSHRSRRRSIFPRLIDWLTLAPTGLSLTSASGSGKPSSPSRHDGKFDEALTACCNLTWSSPQSPLEVYHVRPRP